MRFRVAYTASALLLALGVVRLPAQAPRAVPAPASVPPSWAEPPGDWPMAGKNYANSRYSELNQINAGNVNTLKLAWSYSLDTLRGQEAAPIVADNTMFVVAAFPSPVYALDPVKGTNRWTFWPTPNISAAGVACCDTVNRGGAYWEGKFFFNTLDLQTWALDARNGALLWKTKLGNINLGETMTMAPTVAKGKVFVGNSGGEFGVRGWFAALDANSGRLLWKAYATGPDSDVLIGPRFRAPYAADRGRDLGLSTWPPEQWRIGGGTAWGFVSFDPSLNLVYYGTANPGPWNPTIRPGANKWTSTVFARDPDTGEAVWAYQYTPHDEFDYDAINEHVLIDLNIGGRLRKVFAHPDRNGHLYVIDRATGELLSADPFVFVNTSFKVDFKTGMLIKNPAKTPHLNETTRAVCPAAPGGKDWPPSAYSPRTGLLYIPHNNLCMDWEPIPVNFIAGTPYVGNVMQFYAGPGGHRGAFTAWDILGRRAVWSIPELFPSWSGALATAGDVVFYGTMDRWFKAIDARTGTLLWQFQAGSGIIGQPVTYMGRDGKQYVAILSGVGGWAGALVSGGLDSRDGTAAAGFVNAVKDLPQYTQKGGALYVFSLP